MEEINRIINNLIAECDKQNMYDESRKIGEAKNIIEEVYKKIMKYESKTEENMCDKCIESFVVAEKVKEEKKK